jgi:thiamine biosynthesis lipoprotein
VSVAAADCAQANVAATAALLRGDGAPGWLHELGLPARLQPWDGRAVMVGDWPREPHSPTRAEASRERVLAA